MRTLASNDNLTRLRVCGQNIITIYPKSRKHPMGGPEVSHGVYGLNEGLMAYLLWLRAESRGRFL